MTLLVSVAPLYAQENEPQPETVEAPATIIDVVEEDGNFSTLLAALDAAELRVVLQGEGPFTLFAPTDEAFAKLPEGTLENLMKPEHKDQLIALLNYHVVQGQATASDATEMAPTTTLQGDDLTIVTDEDGTVTVNDAVVVEPDIEASNGIIHVIDTVLMLPNDEDGDM